MLLIASKCTPACHMRKLTELASPLFTIVNGDG
jgi:hypothetical protein